MTPVDSKRGLLSCDSWSVKSICIFLNLKSRDEHHNTQTSALTGGVGRILELVVRTAFHRALHKTCRFIHILRRGKCKRVEGTLLHILMLAMKDLKKTRLHAKTHDPQTIHWNFSMKNSDAVFPPPPCFGVGEVGKSRRTRPNLVAHYEIMHDKSTSRRGKTGKKREKLHLTFPIKIFPEEFLMKTSRFRPSSNGG